MSIVKVTLADAKHKIALRQATSAFVSIASAFVASDCNMVAHRRRKQPPDGDGSRRFWLMGVVVDRQGERGLTNDYTDHQSV